MIEIPVSLNRRELPSNISEYLAVADERISGFYTRNGLDNLRGFVPSDYVTIFHALRTIHETNLMCGESFCEWGSGLGVVASLAAMIGFESCGIEIDSELFAESEDLADEFEIPVEFVNGSFVPYDADDLIDAEFRENDPGLNLVTLPDDAYQQLGAEIADFDLIFAFPWPNDEELTAQMFERFGSDGALLLTYCEQDSVRLRRK